MSEASTSSGLVLRVTGSFGGSGLSPFMPGTCGTIAASACIFGVEHLLSPPWWWMPIAGVIVFLLGVPLATACVKRFSDKDPQWFVVDEVAGVLLASSGLAILTDTKTWLALVVGFFCFRVFDILKPWPIRRVESIGVGFGVMIDDIVAGLLAWPCGFGLLLLLA